MSSINYEPLTEQLGTTHTKATRYMKPVLIGTGLMALLLVLVPLLSIFMNKTLLVAFTSSAPVLAMALFIGLVTAGVMYGLGVREKQIARLQKFADANGAQLIHDTAVTGYNGLIFDNGHDRQMREAIRFSDGLEIGNYNFTTGSGKNSRTHIFAFVRVPLTRDMPHIMLDAKRGNVFGSNLPDSFDRSQRLQLEGDFNAYFDVYVPKEYETDALYVFTPDVMQALMDHGSNLDIEIVGKELYMYQSASLDLSSAPQLQSFLTIVGTLSTEILSQSKRYVDERGTLTANGSSMVAAPGRQLKKGVNWILIAVVAGVAMINIGINLIPGEYALLFTLLTGFIFWAVVIGLIVRSVQRRR